MNCKICHLPMEENYRFECRNNSTVANHTCITGKTNPYENFVYTIDNIQVIEFPHITFFYLDGNNKSIKIPLQGKLPDFKCKEDILNYLVLN